MTLSHFNNEFDLKWCYLRSFIIHTNDNIDDDIGTVARFVCYELYIIFFLTSRS
jgi:hypothetical protein